MKSVIVIEIEHHPGVPTVDNLVKVLDVLLTDGYAVRGHTITTEKDVTDACT